MANSNIPIKIEFGGIDNISPVLRSMTLRLGKLSSVTENLDKSFKKISFASLVMMSSQVNNELQKFSSKFNGILSGSIDDSSNMEDNLNRVRILLEKKPSDNFLGGLNKQWRELSEVSTMSASEISDVSKDIVNSGVRDTDTISKFTNLSILLADASKRELGATEAFSLLNEFKNSFGLKNKDLAKLTDQIVLARDNGTAHYEDIKEGFKYAAPTWGALTNATPADYLAVIAQLSNHGITGSTAGTALRRLPLQFIESLDKSTLMRLENGADEDFKGTLEDFKSNKHNAVLKILGLNYNDMSDKTTHKIDIFKALNKIKENLPKLSQKDQSSVLNQLFGKEALSTGLTAIRFMDEITKTVDLVKNHSEGKAQEFAGSTRNTLSSKIKESKAAWENFKLSLLDGSTGESLKSITDLVKSLGKNINTLPAPMKNFVGYLGLSTYGIVELSAALAPLMMTLYFMSSTFKIIAGMSLFTAILSEIGLVINSFKILTSITAIWNAISAANPYVLLFMAISAAVLLVINNLDWFKKEFNSIYDYMSIKLKYILDKYKELSAFIAPNFALNQEQNSPHDNNNSTQDNSKQAYDWSKDDFFNPRKWSLPSSHELTVKFDNAPSGTKIIQKTKNAPPVNVKLGYSGGNFS